MNCAVYDFTEQIGLSLVLWDHMTGPCARLHEFNRKKEESAMRALVYEKRRQGHAAIREVPAPVCGDGQVLVRVMACCICKPADSRHDNGTSMMGAYPVIPGHEFSGVVEAVGRGVTHFRPGDRVAVDNGAPCWTCYHCQRGEFAFCEAYKAMGQNLDGGFAELAVAPESHVYAIPERVTMRAAALSELVGCAYHCIDRCRIPQAADVLILGCGASGMLLAMLAKSTAAATVTVIDCEESKLRKIAAKGVNTVLVDRADYSRHEAVCPSSSHTASMSSSTLRRRRADGTQRSAAESPRGPLSITPLPIRRRKQSH